MPDLPAVPYRLRLKLPLETVSYASEVSPCQSSTCFKLMVDRSGVMTRDDDSHWPHWGTPVITKYPAPSGDGASNAAACREGSPLRRSRSPRRKVGEMR